uniref:Putative secreted peptide n=1 Tax=Rhipicephalus pulchellus TaxID=72859 RepID=L7MA49_RHIPC
MSLKVGTLSLFAVTLMLICGYYVTTAYPHRWSSPVVCWRSPCRVADDCPRGCRCVYYRAPVPEAKKGPAQMVCSG